MLLPGQPPASIQTSQLPQENIMSISSIQDVLLTVQTYLDGLYEGDTKKLRQTFHEVSHLHSLADGKVSDLPLEDWCKLVEGRASPKSQNFGRELERIVRVEESAPNCANVTLTCAVPGRFFTDHLSLLKAGGRWQIVNKVFHSRSLE
ncbi:nuclear transport factor 2 family protein [Afipia massiliensis]|uniref:Nuclear transport factor 2 family protein n=2 Tax=Afipia massiliensis TaxID=211460 RepID=A0A4U6BJU6_9BRAD|nr:nuclear transport factor 2 family protein [Afipia massiliensis]